MKKEFYDKWADPFEADEKKKRRLIRVNAVITKVVYVIYPAMLVVLAVRRDTRVFRAFLVPFVMFVAVTIFRKACNAPRPYEVWDESPLIPKDTKGNSFPSRHVFSVYMIAMTALYLGISPGWTNGTSFFLIIGIALMVVGVFLAAARVIARVHFLKDVITGAMLGILLGYVGFFLVK